MPSAIHHRLIHFIFVFVFVCYCMRVYMHLAAVCMGVSLYECVRVCLCVCMKKNAEITTAIISSWLWLWKLCKRCFCNGNTMCRWWWLVTFVLPIQQSKCQMRYDLKARNVSTTMTSIRVQYRPNRFSYVDDHGPCTRPWCSVIRHFISILFLWNSVMLLLFPWITNVFHQLA